MTLLIMIPNHFSRVLKLLLQKFPTILKPRPSVCFNPRLF